MTIGERIRAERKKAGLSMKEVASRMGLTYQTLENWEIGNRNPTVKTIKKIAKALEIPFETLILDDENERSNAMDESKTINFGSGPVGLQQEIDEEQLKELVEEIDKDTKEAGLPWWAGMFNPKIIKASGIGRSECNCAGQKDPVTARGEEKMCEKIEKLKEESDTLRAEQNKQIELYNTANERCMVALEAMETGMEKLQTAIVENNLSHEELGNLVEQLAKLGSSVSMVRMSMGLQIPPYVMGINSGFNPPTKA